MEKMKGQISGGLDMHSSIQVSKSRVCDTLGSCLHCRRILSPGSNPDRRIKTTEQRTTI